MKEKIKLNIIYIIIIFVLIIISSSIIYVYINNVSKSEVVVEAKPKKEIKKEEKKEDVYFYVDIKGAINNPNVYKLKENSRVIDVINEAGGLKENADTSNINLSKKIFDEMFIVIYTKEEINKYKEKTLSTKEINEKLQKEIVVIDENNDANIKSTKKSTSKITKKEEENEKEEVTLVNINTASKEDLLKINGIGESKADAIISFREENGDFKQIEDIKNVTGIGDSLFEKIKEFITV